MRRLRGVTAILVLVMAAAAAPAVQGARAAPGGLVAQEPRRNPELLARDYFGDDRDAEKHPALIIRKLKIEIETVGGLARTTVTAEVGNPQSRQLEADFTFDLPAGSVVSGYALDVDGRMVEGVLESPRKARLAYQAVVRRRVDPGLAEITRENAFHTQVSPVMPGRGRTIRLTFVTPFDSVHPYHLPLWAPEPLVEGEVVVRSKGSGPAVELSGNADLAFKGAAGDLRAEVTGRPLKGGLELRAAAGAPELALSRHASGETFFDLSGAAPAASGANPAGGRLRIYWDASRSRAKDDHEREIALVRAYVARARPAAVELVAVSDQPSAAEALPTDPMAVAARLLTIAYRGATSYRALAQPAAGGGVCLLVSDGRPSVDAYGPRKMGCRLYTASSTHGADGGLLTAFARASGGTWLNLATLSGDALAQTIQTGPGVTAVTDGVGKAVAYADLAAPRGRFRLIGPAPSDGMLKVRFSDGTERTWRLGGPVAAHDGAGVLWGAARVAELAATDRPDAEAVLAVSRRYSVASQQASFIVLETVADYVRTGVRPPDDFGKDAVAEYAEARAAIEVDARREKADRLTKIIGMWEAQKAWWKTRFDPNARATHGEVSDITLTGSRRSGEHRIEQPLPPPPLAVASPVMAPRVSPDVRAAAGSNEINELVVTGEKRKDDRIQLQVEPWNPKRPYLDALRAAPRPQFWAVYETQAKRYGSLPAYYLDVAEMLFRAGRAADARRVALEAFEVPTADETTLMTLANRLERYGDRDRALWAYERVAFLMPDRPQPLRNLALALIDRAERPATPAAERKADYRRALDLLAKVILTPWDGAYDGIEMISLMEANRIIPKMAALGIEQTALDERLVALLDVDIRVVLEWNTDATDMDLWVDEPNGERAYYRNQRTTMGGHMSDDMTGGFGPEEYLLRHARDGAFDVRADVFAPDQLNPNGATSVRATLYRNYGRANESKQSLDIEVQGRKDNALIGRLRVGGPPASPK